MRTIELPRLPNPTGTGDPYFLEFGLDRAEFDRFWRIVLMMAVRDRAVSVHWHSWRAADALGYVVDGIRYSLVRPPPEFDDCVAISARRLITPSFLTSPRVLPYILGGKHGLIGRWFNRPIHGRFQCQCEYGPSDWYGVWWRADGRCGADFHRLDVDVKPIHTAGERPG